MKLVVLKGAAPTSCCCCCVFWKLSAGMRGEKFYAKKHPKRCSWEGNAQGWWKDFIRREVVKQLCMFPYSHSAKRTLTMREKIWFGWLERTEVLQVCNKFSLHKNGKSHSISLSILQHEAEETYGGLWVKII